MAGSYNHLLNENGNFTMGNIDNMGDAAEALADCFDIVRRLRAKIADLETKLERAVVIGTDHEGAYWLEVTTAENLRADLAKVERERDEARANYQFMVDHAANEKLDGYRQLGQRAATAENERDEVRQQLAETERRRWDAEDALTAERERTKRRTEQLEICRREVVRLMRLVNEGKNA